MERHAPTAEHTPLVARRLGMIFRGRVVALHDVSLDIRTDDFLVVLGPSGAGKSTLLRSLNRLNTPTSGEVRFRGENVTHATGRKLRHLRRQVGMVFQQFNLVGRLSVLENVLAGRLQFARNPLRFGLSHLRRFGRTDQDVAFEALKQVGVADKAHQRASELSGGQQQRVAIARLLAQRPRVILADEPIASLDPRSAEIVLELLREIHESQGIPVVVNLHQVDFARRYATRIVGMRAGRIVFDGPPTDLDSETVTGLYGHAAPIPTSPKTSSPALAPPARAALE